MVRINLIKVRNLSDQHLIAEYNEILMLLSYVRKYPGLEEVPENYCLGKGHQKFFKDKLLYLRDRHRQLTEEMKRRGFKVNRKLSLKGFDKRLLKNWNPGKDDLKIIKRRLTEKINKRPEFYRYYSEKKGLKFFENLISKG